MVKDFYKDANKAKKAERIVREVLAGLTSEYKFYDVSEDIIYWHIGDIDAMNLKTKQHVYIDVKDDGCTAYTGNVLAEDYVLYHECNKKSEGFMRKAKYDFVAYVSQPENKIYMFDFLRWKEVYQKGRFKKIQHEDQTTYAYIMSLNDVRKYGVMIAEIDYEFTGTSYVPVEVKSVA